MSYKVKWNLGDTTWEPEENLMNCTQKIEEFWKRQGNGKIHLNVICLEKNHKGEKIPSARMKLRETMCVGRVRKFYANKMGLEVKELWCKGRILKDDEIIKGLDGEIVIAVGFANK